jgi:hypothetical protein
MFKDVAIHDCSARSKIAPPPRFLRFELPGCATGIDVISATTAPVAISKFYEISASKQLVRYRDILPFIARISPPG